MGKNCWSWMTLLVMAMPGWAGPDSVRLHPPVSAPPSPEPQARPPLVAFQKEDPKKQEVLPFPAVPPPEVLPDLCPQTQWIDLPTALQLADGQNPEIGLARERIRQALAQQNRAEVLWLPHLDFAPLWQRHDGQIQRFNGEIATASRSSLFVGGGPTFAFHPGDALFASLAARQITTARQAGAEAVRNDLLLDVALTYLDLLQVYAELQISGETFQNARHFVKVTESNQKRGAGIAADTQRALTEAAIREREHLEIQGRARLVSARLAELLNLPPDLCFHPLEPALFPLVLVPEDLPLPDLIAQGIQDRPEVAETRALSQAARERWRAARIAPLVPSLYVGYSAGGFGGGPNDFFGNFYGRGDATALAVWRLENLGLGNLAERRERQSQFTQTTLHQATVANHVAAQIVAAASLAQVRRRELASAQRAVQAAFESYRLNANGVPNLPKVYRPIELLQALQALSHARLDYLQVVADYNRAQFRLYTALGNPPQAALDQARRLPLTEPLVPPTPPEKK